MNTQPHPDPAVARHRARTHAAVRAQQVAAALKATTGLPMLAQWALQQAACEYAVGETQAARQSLALSLDAALAQLEAAARPGEPLRYSLAGQQTEQPSRLGPGQGHAGIWLQCFESALVLGDAPARRRLAAVPLSLPLTSTAQAEAYLAHWLRALHGWLTQGRFDGDLMLQALEATDPAVLPAEIVDFTLAVEVPAMALAWRLALDEAPAAEAALRDGLDKHERFWRRAAEAREPDGFVSWRLSAWKALAAERGLALATRSRYLFEAAPEA